MVGGFDVAGGEIADVGFEGGGRGAVLGRESITVRGEGIGVPLRGEDGGKGREGVGELYDKKKVGYLVFFVVFRGNLLTRQSARDGMRQGIEQRLGTLTSVSFTNEIGQMVPST